jgi:ribosome-associated translation inhibitor RaiA
MLALLADDTLHICVFNGQKLDFLRTKKIEADSTDQNAYTQAIAEQIVSVVQFYELEKTQHHGAWQIFLSCRPNASQAVMITEQLKKFTPQNIEINPVLPEHLNIVNKTDRADFAVAAVEAAMKRLKRTIRKFRQYEFRTKYRKQKIVQKELVILSLSLRLYSNCCLILRTARTPSRQRRPGNRKRRKNYGRCRVLIRSFRAQRRVNEQTSTIRNNLAGLVKIGPAGQ